MKLASAVRGSLIFDGEDSTYNYIGEAPVGADEGSPVWRIYRLTNSGTSTLKKQWADGNSNFDNIWSNRTSLTYI